MLDDVDDLPLETQAKLLRALQDGSFRRIGSTEDLCADARVVATTKIPLEQAVADRRFRDDLFYRLRGPEIDLPPLRARGDDILLLTEYFLRVAANKVGEPAKSVSPEAARVLRRYRWPGNVRELARAIETAVAMRRGDEIDVQHLPEFLAERADPNAPYQLLLDDETSVDLGALVEQFEDEVIDWAMSRASGQQVRAAEILNVPRTTLQSKLARRKG